MAFLYELHHNSTGWPHKFLPRLTDGGCEQIFPSLGEYVEDEVAEVGRLLLLSL